MMIRVQILGSEPFLKINYSSSFRAYWSLC